METVASCPGKVLLAGGYLVLNRQHRGLVVSTPSRFYTVVRSADSSSADASEGGSAPERSGDGVPIKVVSPQFEDGRWDFVARGEESQWRVEPVEREG